MVYIMADITRQQKLVSAKRKLKKFQKGKSPTIESVNSNLESEIKRSVASYKRSNQQLMMQVNEQRKQLLMLQDKLKNNNVYSHQLTEQRALKEQLEVHIQTIGILVSEKSELQSNITSIQKKLASKDDEFMELNNLLNVTRQKIVEMQKSASQMQANENKLKMINSEVIQERDKFCEKLYDINHFKDDMQLQNSELQAKLKSKVSECTLLLNQVNELHIKLQKCDIMIQQLSSNSIDSNSIDTWHKEKETLLKTITDQKNDFLTLLTDKSELSQKYIDIQGDYDLQIEQYKDQINSLENENLQLVKKTQNLSKSIDNLEEELTKKKPLEQQNLTSDRNESKVNSNEQFLKIRTEKLCLEKELDLQITENRRLAHVELEQNEKIEELHSHINHLLSESVDKSSLLSQLQSDKETISRALHQNKELKEQLEELQEAFVKMSNKTADLTGKLELERHGNKDIAEKLSITQLQLEETRMQNDIGSSAKILDSKLQQEFLSAQETINKLSFQNDELKHVIVGLEERNLSVVSIDPPSDEVCSSGEDAICSSGEDENETVTDGEYEQSWNENFIVNDKHQQNYSPGDITDSSYTNSLQLTQSEFAALQINITNLQEERERILQLLQNEREKTFNTVEKMEEHVELRARQQLQLRERELQEYFYEQTEALHFKVKSLQEALEIMRRNEDIGDFDMTSDGITMPLLKTSFMQLQKRYKSAMDAKAHLHDRIEQLEHTNLKLETETETIGEYIALYQTQRKALKTKFYEKDSVISHLSNEHARMQTKVMQLHQLVIQMLSDRSGIESKNKQLQELVNRRLALHNGDTIEGTGDIPTLEYNLDNMFGKMTLTQEEENELTKDKLSVEEEYTTTSTDQTTQQILNIFEQLETSGEGFQYGWLSPAARKHNFQPCVNCASAIIDV